jgi:hypothetical protein
MLWEFRWLRNKIVESILLISNKMSKFKVDVFNSVYEINIDTSFKKLNNVKLCTPLNALILNLTIKLIVSI